MRRIENINIGILSDTIIFFQLKNNMANKLEPSRALIKLILILLFLFFIIALPY